MNILTLWFIFVVIPGIKTTAEVLTILSVLGFVIFSFAHGMLYSETYEKEDKEKIKSKYIKYTKTFAIFIGIFVISFNIIPNTTQIWQIASVYIGTNTEGVEELPGEVVQALRKYLKDYTEMNSESDSD